MKKVLSVFLSLVCIVSLVGCGSSNEQDKSDDKTIIVGATSVPHAEILNDSVKDQLKEEGYKLEVKVFDDYTLINEALDSGELDANYFQHTPYLTQEIDEKGYDLKAVAKIHYEPLGLYSDDTKEVNNDFSVDDVKEGSKIVVPDDATNEARALQLLASKKIITLKDGVGLEATKADIEDNPKKIEIVEVAADSCAASLGDADYVIINGNYALTQKVTDKLICSEDKDSEAAKTYANVIAVRSKDKDSKKTKALKKALTSEKTKKFIEDTYKGTVIASF